MSRRLALCADTGKLHIVMRGVTLCGHRRLRPVAWQDRGPWLGEDVAGLCRSCQANAERSRDVLATATKGGKNG